MISLALNVDTIAKIAKKLSLPERKSASMPKPSPIQVLADEPVSVRSLPTE